MKQEELERRRNLKKAEEEADLLGDFIRLADHILVENLVLLAIDNVREFFLLLKENKGERPRALFQTTIRCA